MLYRNGATILVLLGVAAAVVLWLYDNTPRGLSPSKEAPVPRSERTTSERSTNEDALQSGTSKPSGSGAPAHDAPLAPQGATTELPRFAPEHYGGGLRSLAAIQQPDGPVDRRAHPGPRAKQELEAIRYGLDTLDDDVAACLEQWNRLDGRDAGSVLLGFNIDAKGLQRSWVQSDADVPFGPRTCLANAVYGIDWSHIVDAPVQVTNRFDLSPKDGGP
jgi:hypothetical protein